MKPNNSYSNMLFPIFLVHTGSTESNLSWTQSRTQSFHLTCPEVWRQLGSHVLWVSGSPCITILGQIKTPETVLSELEPRQTSSSGRDIIWAGDLYSWDYSVPFLYYSIVSPWCLLVSNSPQAPKSTDAQVPYNQPQGRYIEPMSTLLYTLSHLQIPSTTQYYVNTAGMVISLSHIEVYAHYIHGLLL